MADKNKTDSKKETIVYQANPLVEGRRDFTLIETRLFYIGLRDLVPRLTEQVKPWDNGSYKDFPTTKIQPSELIEMFGNNKYYNTLQGICREFAKKTVEIKNIDDKGFEVYPLFAQLKYKPDEGLTLVFNPFMIPWLLDLADKPFTKLPFEQVWALHSSYAIRVLELVLQYQNTKTHERTITIDELKQYLGMSLDSYEGRNNTFKEKVVMGSIKDINEKTFYKVEVETMRDDRKIAAFKCKLHLPSELKKQKQKKKAQEALDIIAGLAEGKAMTGNTTSSDSQKKRPMPDFVVKDKDGNKIEHPYAEPVRIKDGKTIL